MRTISEEQLDTLFNTLWDIGWDRYPDVVSPLPGMSIYDADNQEKQIAYRRGCCDSLNHFVLLMRRSGFIKAPEAYKIEDFIKLKRQINGL